MSIKGRNIWADNFRLEATRVGTIKKLIIQQEILPLKKLSIPRPVQQWSKCSVDRGGSWQGGEHGPFPPIALKLSVSGQYEGTRSPLVLLQP